MANVKEVAAKYGDYLIEKRRYFHENPELSGEEFNTSKVVKEELDKMGVEWKACGLETGVLATIKGSKPGKTILIRGDMDALPVEELNDVPYVSKKKGLMHACGHDCHTAMMLTAAQILKDMKDELCGTVKLAFQPAEETAQGAKSMIAQGALEGVDGCFGIHVWQDVPSGKVLCDEGPRMGAADHFKIDIKGKGSHGAAPHQGVDAAVVTAAVINNLQALVSRETDPADSLVVTVGKVDVGTRWNIVPENAHIEGTLRCLTKDLYNRLPDMVERVVKNTAAVFGADATVEIDRLTAVTENDEKFAGVIKGAVNTVWGENSLYHAKPTLGGEDFSFFLDKCPGGIALVGIGNEACGAVWPHHSGHFTVDEDQLLNAAELYVQVAMDFNSRA